MPYSVMIVEIASEFGFVQSSALIGYDFVNMLFFPFWETLCKLGTSFPGSRLSPDGQFPTKPSFKPGFMLY